MEQYIKIKARNDEGDFLGTFKLSIDIEYPTRSIYSIVEKNKEIELDSSITICLPTLQLFYIMFQ